MNIYADGREDCMAPLHERWGSKPARGPRTLSVHPTEGKARRALTDLLGGATAEGYHVVESERGWEVVREP